MNKALLTFSALMMVLFGSLLVYMAMRAGRADVEAVVLPTQTATDAPPPPRAKKDIPPGWLDQFTLTERSGKEFKSSDLDGQVWAASVFFADCPYECKQQNESIAQFAKEFGPEGVKFVSITCNPERDTPERLREYARNFTKSEDQWLFLTGEMNYIRRVGAEFFGVPIDNSTHGSRLILVDKWGNIRGYFSTNGTRSPQEFAQIRPMLQKLLAEKAPPEDVTKQEGAAGDILHEVKPEEATTEATADGEKGAEPEKAQSE